MLDKKKVIAEFLTAKGLITPLQLDQAKKIQEKTQDSIENILRKFNIVCDETLNNLIVEQLSLNVLKLGVLDLDIELLERINSFFANRFRIFPLKFEKDTLFVAFDNPLNFLSLEYFSEILNANIEAELIDRQKMDEYLERYYPRTDRDIFSSLPEKFEEESDLADEEAPVIQLVSMLISDAYQKRASDIHVEPMNDELRIRYRIDGLLQKMQSPQKNLQASIISRIKLMAGMDIAEHRLPQDGRIRTVVDAKEFDLRVSTMPAHYGESLVLRILDCRVMRIEEIGFSDKQREAFENIVNLPNGIILVTGPTGSGKSTTLYAVLGTMDRARRKILTVEDPVEYQISGINQVQVKPLIGLNFARVLRSMLRQAPDIIMVGEIRDLETASISVQSALTGHLIFSTLHTNDAPSAVARLVDMGVKPYLVAATLRAVLAQRLIRLLCPFCKEAYRPPKDELRILELDLRNSGLTFYRAVGCSRCVNTGYFGRTGIFELLVVDDNIRQLIHEHLPSSIIREEAIKKGMLILKQHATQKVMEGLTTFQEVMRITQTEID
ncbi:MAG: ATPase, T2SS/T4P/T4SS family [Candidatus Omnitrophota bacterium]